MLPSIIVLVNNAQYRDLVWDDFPGDLNSMRNEVILICIVSEFDFLNFTAVSQ